VSATLEETIANWRSDADALRRTGHTNDARLLDRCADEATQSAYEYLNWLTEPEARLRSGHSTDWLRSRFGAWAEQGLARWDGRKRQYRAVALPTRAHRELARAAGRRAVEER
jgi:hypothetical protein